LRPRPHTAVVVVAYDSGDALGDCLDSLRGEADEVVVVNNGGPLTVDRGGVHVIDSSGNVGFGAGCNLGARATEADALVFLNPDTVVRPGAVAALARRLEDPTVGAAQARLRLLDRPDLLNSGGNVVHVSGLAWPGDYGEPASSLTEAREIAYASGAALAIRADVFRDLGGFAEELFLYQEDLELCWRVRMRGLRVVVEPDADVLHRYVLERPDRRKEHYLERNRLIFLLTAYSGRLLLLLAPVLLAVEAGIVALALRDGWLREKARGWLWLARHAGWLARRRAHVQRMRRVPDRELASVLTPVLDPRMLSVPGGVAAADALVAAWWRLVRVLL
jgi:GT2 family glycosyltransferase